MSRPVVFVIDDNTLTRMLLSDALRMKGYEPVPFPSAQEALRAIDGRVPVACFVDQTMPGMSGAEFIRALRHSDDARIAQLPVIGISGGCEDELAQAGATRCLRKPVSEADVAAALAGALAAPTSAAAAGVRAGQSMSVADFRRLHELARAGRLAAADLALYRAMRSELAETFLAMQQIALSVRSRARRALRVVEQLRVDLHLGGQPIFAETIDVGQGGFSAVVKLPLALGVKVGFRLHLAAGDCVEGFARVANSVPAGEAGQRVGLAFVGLDADRRERIELRVFDAVVKQLESAKQG